MSTNAARPALIMQHFEGRSKTLSVQLKQEGKPRTEGFWPGVWAREDGTVFAVLEAGVVVEGPDAATLLQNVQSYRKLRKAA